MPRIAPSEPRAYIASASTAGSLTRGIQQRATEIQVTRLDSEIHLKLTGE